MRIYCSFQIHHDLAKYHEMGRFAKTDDDIDMEAALFHERTAAELGVMEAILNMARLYLGMQRDVLINYELPVSQDYFSNIVEFSDKRVLV